MKDKELEELRAKFEESKRHYNQCIALHPDKALGYIGLACIQSLSGEHKKAIEAFKRFVESGELDVELLNIYQEALVRANSLLGIFEQEKKKKARERVSL
jgi:tetratricopeptide (TPR) repeat protein